MERQPRGRPASGVGLPHPVAGYPLVGDNQEDLMAKEPEVDETTKESLANAVRNANIPTTSGDLQQAADDEAAKASKSTAKSSKSAK